MTDVSKLKILKKKSSLGEPPPMEEASMNLNAPEIAPSISVEKVQNGSMKRLDGRSARRTNRTMQFATRVTPEWDARIRALAHRQGVLLVEILERSLDFYEKNSAR